MIDHKQLHKPDETPILFVNFREEEFTGYWDKAAYTFAPHESKWLPLWLAMHFSKSIVDAEMNSRKMPTDHSSRESFVAKCIGNTPDKKQDHNDPLGIDILNKNKAAELAKDNKADENVIDKPSKKPGRPKKSDEEAFEGK